MSMSQMLSPELEQELAHTRRALERVPEDRLGWKPHEKSMTMGRLASHIGEVLQWATTTLEMDEFDIAPPGGRAYAAADYSTKKEILAYFDANAAAAKQALDRARDEAFGETWTLKQGGETAFAMPRMAVLRSFVFSHLVHHRGQLTVYLRLNGVPVPAIYGPSADEQPPGM